MINEGGKNAIDHVRRVLNGLLAPIVQVQVTRTGASQNKEKLHGQIECLLKGISSFVIAF